MSGTREKVRIGVIGVSSRGVIGEVKAVWVRHFVGHGGDSTSTVVD